MISYLCEPRHWVKKIVAIAHNAKSFDLYFILNQAILLKWQHELIMNGMKIMCMKKEHLVFSKICTFWKLTVKMTSLRQACRVFRREFMQLSHIDVFGSNYNRLGIQ